MKHSPYISHHSFAVPPTLSLLRERVIVSATSCATAFWNCRPFPIKDTVLWRKDPEVRNRTEEKRKCSQQQVSNEQVKPQTEYKSNVNVVGKYLAVM